MEISSNVVTTQEEVKTVEKKTLNLTIKVDQEFLDLLNGLGKTTSSALGQMGLTASQQEAVHQFYSKTSRIFSDSPEYIKKIDLGTAKDRWASVEES